MAFFNFSNLTWILLVAVFLLGEGFQLVRFRTLLSNNLSNIALKTVKDSDN